MIHENLFLADMAKSTKIPIFSVLEIVENVLKTFIVLYTLR